MKITLEHRGKQAQTKSVLCFLKTRSSGLVGLVILSNMHLDFVLICYLPCNVMSSVKLPSCTCIAHKIQLRT